MEPQERKTLFKIQHYLCFCLFAISVFLILYHQESFSLLRMVLIFVLISIGVLGFLTSISTNSLTRHIRKLFQLHRSLSICLIIIAVLIFLYYNEQPLIIYQKIVAVIIGAIGVIWLLANGTSEATYLRKNQERMREEFTAWKESFHSRKRR